MCCQAGSITIILALMPPGIAVECKEVDINCCRCIVSIIWLQCLCVCAWRSRLTAINVWIFDNRHTMHVICYSQRRLSTLINSTAQSQKQKKTFAFDPIIMVIDFWYKYLSFFRLILIHFIMHLQLSLFTQIRFNRTENGIFHS